MLPFTSHAAESALLSRHSGGKGKVARPKSAERVRCTWIRAEADILWRVVERPTFG